MRKLLIILGFSLLGLHQAQAATATANISAHVLKPVYISMEDQSRDTSIGIHSIHVVHYELSHKQADVCVLGSKDPALSKNVSKLALAQCESYTVNFN